MIGKLNAKKATKSKLPLSLSKIKEYLDFLETIRIWELLHRTYLLLSIRQYFFSTGIKSL